MADLIMRNFKKEMLQGNIDLDGDTFKVALLSGTNTIYENFETMIAFSAAQVYETSGTGYTAGGITLTANPITLDGSDAIWDALDVTWEGSTINADAAVVYKFVTNANDSPLVCYVDLYNKLPVGYKTSNNGSFTIQWNTEGIISLGS
jgi:hypothetical protein